MVLRPLAFLVLGWLLACEERSPVGPSPRGADRPVALGPSEMETCSDAAAKSGGANRLAQALGLCLERELPGPFALRLEVQVSPAGARLVAQAGANPLIPASLLETCITQKIRDWSVRPVDEVVSSSTGLVEMMSLELGREQGGDLQVRSQSTCTPPLPGAPLVAAMEPLEMAPDCEGPLGSAAKQPGPMVFALNIVRAQAEKGAVCSPVTEGLPSGFITCMCADLLARDAAKAARRPPSEGKARALVAPQGHRHWIVRRRIAGRPVYHRLEGLPIPAP